MDLTTSGIFQHHTCICIFTWFSPIIHLGNASRQFEQKYETSLQTFMKSLYGMGEAHNNNR